VVYLLQLLANLEQVDPNRIFAYLKSPPHFGFPVGDPNCPQVRKDLECNNFSSTSPSSPQHNHHGDLSQEALEAGPGAACIR
jgi:hypothetical protein